MKALLIYWIFGCFVIGSVVAGRMNDCPNEKIKTEAIVSAVAIWPAAIVAAIGLKKASSTSCDVAPSPDPER